MLNTCRKCRKQHKCTKSKATIMCHFLLSVCSQASSYTAWKFAKFGVFSGPYFPVFLYCGVNIRIQFEYRKIYTRKNSVFGHFSRSDSTQEQTYTQENQIYCMCCIHVTKAGFALIKVKTPYVIEKYPCNMFCFCYIKAGHKHSVKFYFF